MLVSWWARRVLSFLRGEDVCVMAVLCWEVHQLPPEEPRTGLGWVGQGQACLAWTKVGAFSEAFPVSPSASSLSKPLLPLGFILKLPFSRDSCPPFSTPCTSDLTHPSLCFWDFKHPVVQGLVWSCGL